MIIASILQTTYSRLACEVRTCWWQGLTYGLRDPCTNLALRNPCGLAALCVYFNPMNFVHWHTAVWLRWCILALSGLIMHWRDVNMHACTSCWVSCIFFLCTRTEPPTLSHTLSLMCINQCKAKECRAYAWVSPLLSGCFRWSSPPVSLREACSTQAAVRASVGCVFCCCA